MSPAQITLEQLNRFPIKGLSAERLEVVDPRQGRAFEPDSAAEELNPGRHRRGRVNPRVVAPTALSGESIDEGGDLAISESGVEQVGPEALEQYEEQMSSGSILFEGR